VSAIEVIGARRADGRPLVAYVVFNFAVGGLENGFANLVNRIPANRYRHVVVSLTDASSEFARQVGRDDVAVYALHKPAGDAWRVYPQLRRLFADLEPGDTGTRLRRTCLEVSNDA
jgi:hypothetical protein